MSSTNRSNARDVHISDYYVTPKEVILDFLKEFYKVEKNVFNGYILDPCAGGDKDHAMSYPEALIEFGIDKDNIYTVDIRGDSLAEIKENYLTLSEGDFNAIITNPPFNIAMNIIEKALGEVKDDGWVIMLLRLNFFGSKSRKVFWDSYMPKYCFVHHNRIKFTNTSGTDSIEYAHFCWQKGNYPNFTQLKVI